MDQPPPPKYGVESAPQSTIPQTSSPPPILGQTYSPPIQLTTLGQSQFGQLHQQPQMQYAQQMPQQYFQPMPQQYALQTPQQGQYLQSPQQTPPAQSPLQSQQHQVPQAANNKVPQQQQYPVQELGTVVPLGNLSSGPAPVQCPGCGKRAVTTTTFVAGNYTHAWALGLCFVTLLGCIPYLLSSMKDVEHKCSGCGAQLAVWHRSGRTEVRLHG